MLDVVECGHGRPVVLIHGSPGNAHIWKGVTERLGDRFRVLAPTLPGHDRPPDSALPAMETSEIAAEIETALARLESAAVVVGHSYGGNVALQLALRANFAAGSVVLLEPVAPNVLRAAGDAELYDATKAVFDRYLAQVDAREPHAVATMVDFWFGPGGYDRVPEKARAYLRAAAPVNARDVPATFREPLTRAALRRIAVPVVVAYGTASPPVTKRIAGDRRFRARRPRSGCPRRGPRDAHHACARACRARGARRGGQPADASVTGTAANAGVRVVVSAVAIPGSRPRRAARAA